MVAGHWMPGSCYGPEPIAYPWLSDDILRAGGIVLYLPAQIAHIYPQKVRLTFVGIAPNLTEKLPVGEYSPGVLD